MSAKREVRENQLRKRNLTQKEVRYEVGDMVLLMRFVDSKELGTKLHLKSIGPFEVLPRG